MADFPLDHIVYVLIILYPKKCVSNHKLPKLSLPTFNGNKLDWQSFWDSFNSGVHDNISLSDVQKFNYLQSLLLGEALSEVEGLALTDANYIKAIDLLKERYRQPHKITRIYMQALLDLPEPTDALHSFSEFNDKMETYIRGLETEECYGNLLVHVVLRKLPSKIRQNLARAHGGDDWILCDLRKAIEHELSILEAGSNTDEDWYYNDSICQRTANCYAKAFKGKPTNKRRQQFFQHKPNFETRDAHEYQNKSCVFCDDKTHMGGNCTLTCEQKKIIVKQKSLCFNCLGTHRVKDCPSKRNCKKCWKRHHTYLCNGLRETTHDPTRYERSIPSSAALHASSVANTQTILKTTTAIVTSGKTVMTTNILFDEGSQRSFITEEFAEKLNLKYTGTETLTIAAFGGKEMMRTLKTSTLYLIADSGEKFRFM